MATAKVVTMAKLLSPQKKNTVKIKVPHKKHKSRSKIIVEDFDSKKKTDITGLVSETPIDGLEVEEIT